MHENVGAMTLYVVGKWLGPESWELQGVFTTEQQAVECAIQNDYFVGPVEADTLLPDASTEWPGCYYPG